MDINEFHKNLKLLGLKKSDTVMIHGDAIIATQLNLSKFSNDPTNLLLDILIDYFYPNGTIIVPTFSYNMNYKNVFDNLNSKSEVGLFSEKFRKKINVKRSDHPIFSVSAIGKKTNFLTNYNLKDCFGKNSFFDRFYKINGKILCLGCPMERITFIHYIEQKIGVNYRYIKNFQCAYKKANKLKKLKIKFYVRDLNKHASFDFKYFYPKIKKIIKVLNFGRFKCYSIESQKLFKNTKKLIKKYPEILVGDKNEI